MSVQVSIENVSPVEVSVSEESVPVAVEQTSSIALEVDGKRGVLPNDIGLRKYDATKDVPRTGDPFLFFVADDDGNGAAIGFWDGTDIQICVSLTI